jgi:hypothetical protein
MKRLLIMSAMALGLSAGAALASSHTMRDRAETLEILTVAVETVCAQEATTPMSATDCALATELVAGLYTDPAVVTEDDLERLQQLAAISAHYGDSLAPIVLADATIDLKTLLADTQLATLHLLQDHAGRWPELAG